MVSIVPPKLSDTVRSKSAPFSMFEHGEESLFGFQSQVRVSWTRPQVEQCERGRLGTAANPEFGEDVADVVARGFGADEQPLGDLGVGESLGNECQDLLLPLAQFADP